MDTKVRIGYGVTRRAYREFVEKAKSDGRDVGGLLDQLMSDWTASGPAAQTRHDAAAPAQAGVPERRGLLGRLFGTRSADG